MTRDEQITAAGERLEHECPRRIMGFLHVRRRFVHYSSPRHPGRVMCFDRDTPIPEDCTRTAAQVALDAALALPVGPAEGKVAGAALEGETHPQTITSECLRDTPYRD